MDTHINANNVRTHMGFPHLTKCKGEQTYSEMEIIKKELYENLMAIPSPYGGGTKGNLGILMHDAIYFQRTGEHFTIPDYPWDVAAFPVAATDRQIETLRRSSKHVASCKVRQHTPITWKRSTAPIEVLKVVPLERSTITSYRAMQPSAAKLIMDNKRLYNEVMDEIRPLEIYVRNQENCQTLPADETVPISEADMVETCITNIIKTGTRKDVWKI